MKRILTVVAVWLLGAVVANAGSGGVSLTGKTGNTWTYSFSISAGQAPSGNGGETTWIWKTIYNKANGSTISGAAEDSVGAPNSKTGSLSFTVATGTRVRLQVFTQYLTAPPNVVTATYWHVDKYHEDDGSSSEGPNSQNPGVNTPFDYWVDNRFGSAPVEARVVVYNESNPSPPVSVVQSHTLAVGTTKHFEGVTVVSSGQAVRLEKNTPGGWVAYSPPLGDPTPNPTGEKKITISIPPNRTDFTIQFRLMKTLNGVTTQHSSFTQNPGASGVIQTVTVPNDGATYQVVSRIEGYEFTDGQWIVSEGAVKEQNVSSPVKTEDMSDADAPSDKTTKVEPDKPTETPSAGAATPQSGGTVWRSGNGTTSTDGLTNSVYREGVDKITARQDRLEKLIEGEAVEQKLFDETSDKTTSMAKGPVTGLLSKMPSAPVITLPGDASTTFGVTFTPPGMTTPQTISIDLENYATGITVFKTVVRAVLALWFFFLSLRSVKEAFA